MLLSILRFFRGSVEFTVSGKFPERFINAAARGGVPIWDPTPDKGGIRGAMYLSDYKKIRPLARRAKVRTRVASRRGLPFVINRHKGRPGVFVGAAVSAALCFFLSGFVWSVKISGTENLSDTALTAILAENGVSVGARVSGMDVEKIERSILLEYDDIRWMSINITGSLITVEIKETYKKPDLDESTAPCNVKADCDGVITEIRAHKGVIAVKEGSGVKTGDLLVSGVGETKQGNLLYVRASAEVFADVTETHELSFPKRQNYISLGEKTIDRFKFNFLWASFPCSLSFQTCDNCVSSRRTYSLFVNDTVLPVSVDDETERELVTCLTTIDQKTALKQAEYASLLYEIFCEGDSKTVSRQISIKENKRGYICTINHVFNKNIAKQEEFGVTE